MEGFKQWEGCDLIYVLKQSLWLSDGKEIVVGGGWQVEQEAGAAAQERGEITRLTWEQGRQEKALEKARMGLAGRLDIGGEEKRGSKDVL